MGAYRRMNTGKRLLALAALCAVLISSMAFSSPASAKMKVVTTFTVLADMAANVAGLLILAAPYLPH